MKQPTAKYTPDNLTIKFEGRYNWKIEYDP